MNRDLILSSLRSEREEAVLEGASEEEPGPSQDTTQHCLWVDEFAPQHYTELLSDDVRFSSYLSGTSLPCQREGRAGSR